MLPLAEPIDFSDVPIPNNQSDHHDELVSPPLYPRDPAPSDQARSVTSTWQLASTDGDSNSLFSIPKSPDLNFDFDFDLDLSLDSEPHLLESAENLTQETINPRILGVPNTPAFSTGFEDSQLQQPLVNNRPPPFNFSHAQYYFSEPLLHDSNSRQSHAVDPLEIDHQYHIHGIPPRLPNPSAVQHSSYARLLESNPSTSTRLKMRFLLAKARLAWEAIKNAFDLEEFHANGQDANMSSLSGKMSGDTISRMSSLTLITDVQILDASKASHGQTTAYDTLPNTAKREYQHTSSDQISLVAQYELLQNLAAPYGTTWTCFESMTSYDSLAEFCPKSCILLHFTRKSLSRSNYQPISQRLLNHYVRELPCANYPPSFGQRVP